MHSNPKFSVIITNYNYGEYIVKAINSVLSQTHQDFELIVVDDGSEDDSLDRINSIDQSRMQVVKKSNGGQASAFNAGFEKSKGEIVCFLDSDDWWCEEKLEVLDRWDRLFGGEYALIQHNMAVTDGGREFPYKNTLPSGNCFAEMCKTGNIDYFVPTSGIAIRRAVCERIFPVPPKLRICADAFLTRTAFAFGDVISIPKMLAYYRQHSNLVFQNADFDHSGYFTSTLFPALDEYYRENKIGSARFSETHTPRHKSMLSTIRSFAKRLIGRKR